MKTCEVNMRDPFVMVHGGMYYLYGTRSESCWGPADGFDCYVSEDMENWEGPIEIFHRPDGFFADQNYWAPECVYLEADEEAGRTEGPWKQMEEPIFPENGGHGMMFRDAKGELLFTLHFPNDKYKERPMFARMNLEDEKLRLK
ncbi:hypothetical protein EAI89_13505 [Eubacterium sp. am_0171]|nr:MULTISPECIES: family 43 glycosylhydrolase [Clostridia]MSC84884.1 family 43 glycosylhydrolase [Eubacterium sp. BIOML-A1]MSD07172.1 family 43 glycosylhydrolase [Eubacterium sp. BIOML-A2]RYT16083.1 hypothetical protein EAI89_13505 [Eubacterium sp. am_0171]